MCKYCIEYHELLFTGLKVYKGFTLAGVFLHCQCDAASVFKKEKEKNKKKKYSNSLDSYKQYCTVCFFSTLLSFANLILLQTINKELL